MNNGLKVSHKLSINYQVYRVPRENLSKGAIASLLLTIYHMIL